MKIVISCSMRYESSVRRAMAALSRLGLVPIFPNLDRAKKSSGTEPSPEEKLRLAREHYEAIDGADLVYFIVPGGYMGTSCTLELGYAIARGKPVYFSEPTKDPALDCYTRGFVPTDALEGFLKISEGAGGHGEVDGRGQGPLRGSLDSLV